MSAPVGPWVWLLITIRCGLEIRSGYRSVSQKACFGVPFGIYMAQPYMETTGMLDRDLKRGSTEMLIMAMVEDRPRHGYEIGKLIEQRSQGVLQFHIASLYPLLARLEKRGLIKGRWVEKSGERRRRFYTLTAAGRKILAEQRRTWKDFFAALDLVAGINPG